MKDKLVLVSITALLLSFSGVQAQDPDEGEEAESTIRLMSEAEAELPDAVTKEISLPATVAEDSAAVKNSAKSLEKVNEKHDRREQGLSKADDARDRGAEMANEARDNRENRGRSQDRPDPPKPPGPPDK